MIHPTIHMDTKLIAVGLTKNSPTTYFKAVGIISTIIHS
jgi:hypothetical protein